MSGPIIRATIDKQLKESGVTADALPEVLKFEYAFSKKEWYTDLESWCAAYRRADPQNIAVLEQLVNKDQTSYSRSFVVPGVCRRMCNSQPGYAILTMVISL